jgi:E3 ubiquitin-protein ligase DRIP
MAGILIDSILFFVSDLCSSPIQLQVEIICHGEPICPSSTLRGLMELWHRRQPTEPVEASVGAPAEEFVMVLGYRRHRRPPYLAPGTTVAVPPELPS